MVMSNVFIVRLNESDYVEPGNKCGEAVNTPIGKIGLGICYDLRLDCYRKLYQGKMPPKIGVAYLSKKSSLQVSGAKLYSETPRG